MSKISRSHRVLIVDDEPSLLGAIRRIIERARPDAVVVFANDVESAVWQIESTDLRLVVTDMSMQGDRDAGLRVVEAAERAAVRVSVLSGGLDPARIAALADRNVLVIDKGTETTGALRELIERAFADE